MQGVIKSFDPSSGIGIIMCDSDLADYDLASGALEGSVFRMLRQGQRVVFDLDDAGRATSLRLVAKLTWEHRATEPSVTLPSGVAQIPRSARHL